MFDMRSEKACLRSQSLESNAETDELSHELLLLYKLLQLLRICSAI